MGEGGKVEGCIRKMEVGTRKMGVGSCEKASTLSDSSWCLVRMPREGFERGCLRPG